MKILRFANACELSREQKLELRNLVHANLKEQEALFSKRFAHNTNNFNMARVDEIEHVISERDGKIVICAFDDETMCGYACVSDYGSVVTVEELYVESRSRKKGIGTSLLQACRLYASEIGCDTLSLRVVLANKNAQKLYEKEGFSYVSLLETCDAYEMKSPVSKVVLVGGQLLKDISHLEVAQGAKFGEVIKDNVQFGQYLRDFIDAFNSHSTSEKMDAESLVKARRLLDVGEMDALKIMKIAENDRHLTRTDSLKIPAQIACEMLAKEKSESVKNEGIKHIAKLQARNGK